LWVTLPARDIEEAEYLLQERVITPKKFIEEDKTVHEVMEFQPEPVGYSGFANCVIHSLAQTNQGLFEVGRYPAMHLVSQKHYWQWFLHQRLATSEQAAAWQEEHHLSPQQVVERIYTAMTGRSHRM